MSYYFHLIHPEIKAYQFVNIFRCPLGLFWAKSLTQALGSNSLKHLIVLSPWIFNSIESSERVSSLWCLHLCVYLILWLLHFVFLHDLCCSWKKPSAQQLAARALVCYYSFWGFSPFFLLSLFLFLIQFKFRVLLFASSASSNKGRYPTIHPPTEGRCGV